VRILFVTARFPYPPLRGDQLRAYHQLRLLGPKHSVTLLSFAEKPLPPAAIQVMAPYCEQIITLPQRRREMTGQILQNLFSAFPLQTAIYQTAAMRRRIAKLLHHHTFDLVHLQLARMAPYFENEQHLPRLVDLIDALSLNMERRFRHDHSPLKWAAYFEWKRLKHYEQTICQKFDRVTVVSPFDREAIGPYPNLLVNPNGVDSGSFAFNSHSREPDSIIFSGNMGYFPNVSAVLWFSQHVLPLIKKNIPQVKFYVVGARPARKIRQLAKQDAGIIVTGPVDDIAVYLRRATVAVAPMQAGSGMQNKVIEAMACGAPVVGTSYALGGLEAVPGEHLLAADQPEAFAAEVVRLLQNQPARHALVGNARRLIEQKYNWEHSVAALESIYELMVSSRG
jgi:sugar transferase (PEP-CTERM/EpsH1 system associated)